MANIIQNSNTQLILTIHVQVLVKEEDRLAAVIDEIDREVHIVPRGSYVKTAAGKIVTNRSFEGLNNLDCKKLSSYFHFKSTPNTDKINLLAKVNISFQLIKMVRIVHFD